MALTLHIVIALASVGITTFLLISPSKAKLKLSYFSVVATLASGVYLVVSHPAHMVQACTTGLIYVGAISLGLVTARQKLAVKDKSN